MAAIDDLIAQVDDIALRERLQNELDRLSKEKKFGLVFEEHIPELTPVFSAKVTNGCFVALRNGSLTDTWWVRSVKKGKAQCLNRTSRDKGEFSVKELVVVRQFGEPIFPSLTQVDCVKNGDNDAPWHTLIEADNYHAVQLLEYLYTGQVDCMYIDPPYNTGARDWKYNNDYVDANDRWRHSKWLAMLKRRLIIAKSLLNPETGVLIVTIDEHEVHHLRMLLHSIFPNAYLQMVTAVTNPKGVTQGRFSRVEEYLIYCFMDKAFVNTSDDDLLNPKKESLKPRWKGLLRSGTNARRADRKNMFYPVLIDEQRSAAVGTGEPLPCEKEPNIDEKINGYAAAWPIRTDCSYGNWGVGHETLRELIKLGYVHIGKYDENRKTYAISYLSKPNQKLIEEGKIIITDFDEIKNVVDVEYTDTRTKSIKTMWHRTLHDAGAYGSDLLTNILGRSGSFTFPKSLYSTRDALTSVIRDKKDALIVDFFAGSGTTLHAVALLNSVDKGSRRCILVTNNEVSEEEAKELRSKGYQPGEHEWEKHGICQAVAWPRLKYSILGHRDDGTTLGGEYYSGLTIDKSKNRIFKQIGFSSIEELNTISKKKQLVSLLDGIPQSLVKKDTNYVVPKKLKYTGSILFNEDKADEWIDALEDQDHITNFYIVTKRSATFDDIKARISEMLGPIVVAEEEKRPISVGLSANLEYFKLDFLEKDKVALGRRFREILPILWLRAGAIGPRPSLVKNNKISGVFIPKQNNFAVLIDETQFNSFLKILAEKHYITHVFIVTDSEEAFQEMSAQIDVPNVIQLYQDYLENFMINK